MKERTQFILEATSGLRSFSEVCQRFGISRETGYKWLQRYDAAGPDGLHDRSHRPHSCPHATDPEILEAAFELRRRRPRWGAAKIHTRLATLYPHWDLPCPRVLHKHLLRAGLVRKKRRVRTHPHPGRPTAPFTAPNSIWSADYKGHFKTRDGRYCYPLTLQDGFSRFLLACQAVDGTTYHAARLVFTRLFREFGIPDRIRTDNGPPFSSPLALGRLSRLAVWWIRLGILPDFIEPASPQQNGRHERMHKDLKADACIPPAGNRSAQQRRFNSLLHDFNHIRPHEALQMKTPADVYVPSTRPFPNKLPPLNYPAHFEVRKVSTNGGIRWHSCWVNASHLLGGELVGLEEIADGVWAVFFGPLCLGWLHIDKGAIISDDGSSSRNPRL
ncbi:MAG: leucine zipper domain-containing protein [Gemmatimonadota bacterium]|nr:leucine zipper domain-containing protein [Gemmatimonadota bacterium]